MVAVDASAWIGVDIGTTGTRAVVFNRHGRVLEAVSRTYPLLAPRPGWAAQAPTTVHDATTDALTAAAAWAQAHGHHVRAVGLSAILHSVLPIDASGNALDDALIWADTRGDDEARTIRATHDPLALYRGAPLASADITPLPAAQKQVRFAYRTTAGKTVPGDAKIIWPLPCLGN